MDPSTANPASYAFDPMPAAERTHAAVLASAMPLQHSPHTCPRNRHSREGQELNPKEAGIGGSSRSSNAATDPKPCSSQAADNIPEWQRDFVDLEAACGEWIDPKRQNGLSILSSPLFASKVHQKAQNPASCTSIGYDIRPKSPFPAFCCRVVGFLVYCCFIANSYAQLGLPCAIVPTSSESVAQTDGSLPGKSLVLIWSEMVITTGACFLIAQGYYGVRATRERMERVRQTAITLAYSFLKTTSAEIGGGHGKDALQVLIYECLALLTAFPVALFHQIQGNTCEPAVTRYCQEIAKTLKRLRNGEAKNTWDRDQHSHRRYVTVEYFFELFSLNLDAEYRRQSVKTKTPSMAPQYIIYNLRNHFENIVDMGNLDDRRTPIVRENIDMLALAGRECSLFSYSDVAPVAFMWTVDLCCRALAFGSPIQNCDWLVNATDSSDLGFQIPRLGAVLSWIAVSIVSATILTILNEMWQLWDPFGKAVNAYSWSLGIASEIDNMLNEFYEYDTNILIRKHAYMDASAYFNGMLQGYGNGDCDCPERQTV